MEGDIGDSKGGLKIQNFKREVWGLTRISRGVGRFKPKKPVGGVWIFSGTAQLKPIKLFSDNLCGCACPYAAYLCYNNNSSPHTVMAVHYHCRLPWDLIEGISW